MRRRRTASVVEAGGEAEDIDRHWREYLQPYVFAGQGGDGTEIGLKKNNSATCGQSTPSECQGMVILVGHGLIVEREREEERVCK